MAVPHQRGEHWVPKPPSAAVGRFGCSCGFQLHQSLDLGAVQRRKTGNPNSWWEGSKYLHQMLLLALKEGDMVLSR